jgi:hypothetical protein
MSLHPSFEKLEPNEAGMIAEMTDILGRKMERDYAVGSTLRDAHPKTLGLLRGTFHIEPNLPAQLRVGLFSRRRRLDCWVRTSSASGKLQSDAIKDARGIAIKLMAPGGKGRAGDVSLGQDFILMNAPAMPLGTIAMFRDAVYYSIESSPLLLAAKLLITARLDTMLGLLTLRSNPTSPLDIRYWSTTPYLFGADRAVKYSLLPTSKHKSKMPNRLSESYLTDAMQAHLGRHAADFDFCVQLRRGDMPIEDAAVRWDEAKSPFVKVATLHIPIQKFRARQRQQLAESLSFSPGNALPEHVPLGGLNRARVVIYDMLSKLRHQRDGRADLA